MKSSKKEELEDKTLNPKTVVTKDALETKKTRVGNVTKVSVSSKTKAQVAIDGLKVHKSSSNPSKVAVSKDQVINKIKTTDNAQKTRSSTEHRTTRRVTIQEGIKTKPIPSGTTQKTSSLTVNRNAEKQKIHSKDSKTRNVSNDVQVKERKIKLESSATEVIKNTNQIKKLRVVNKAVEKDRTSKTKVASRSSISSKTTDDPSSKLRTVKTSKPTNKKEQKSSTQENSAKEESLKESVVSETKLELPEEDSDVQSEATIII